MTRPTAIPKTQSGFSLVELLIAMAIGLVMLGAILSIYMGTTVAGRQSDTVSRMGEDAAIALETMARHIRMAGYSKPILMAARNSATVEGQMAQIADSNFTGAGLKGCDGGFSSTNDDWGSLACTDSDTQPDDIAVRYEGDSFNTEAAGGNSASDCLSQGVASTTNSAITGSAQYALVESRFFVSDNKELSCAGNGNAALTAQPLVSGVEFMRVRYGLASDNTEGQVIRFATASEINALTGNADQKWGRVIAVRICLQMVSPSEDQGKAVPYYNCDGTLITPRDKYLHRTFSTTVSVRNRAGIAQ
jgi:type IV pilus assembly protein PilW